MACVLILRPSVASTYRARRSLLLCFTTAHFFWNAGSSTCFNRPYTRHASQQGCDGTTGTRVGDCSAVEHASVDFDARGFTLEGIKPLILCIGRKEGVDAEECCLEEDIFDTASRPQHYCNQTTSDSRRRRR